MKKRTLYNYDFLSDCLSNHQSEIFTYAGNSFYVVLNIYDEFVFIQNRNRYNHYIVCRFPRSLSLSTIRRRFGKMYAKNVISSACVEV